MKLRERYPLLQNPEVVKAMVVRSVYTSVALARVEVLYEQTAPTPSAGATGRQ
jgi:hypothetical protein